ncbi:cytochrome P450 71B10-like [Macadamia integrifolia]|uniref:cytochrome P450 71B10-like n=1 Tax=Macadamia integrifolia TaxID=60698 RepID=UPI001C5272A1|nr:cytochrome P450 71B10-like [Macadamia integrifolia]XP_042475266.1 cytochrome P450 71B10-like [Macadamia integrifolia]
MISLTSTTMPQWLLIPLVALLPLILILKSKQVRRTNLPPGPSKLPIIGNLHQLGELPFRSLRELSKEYGPIMQLQLGRMPTLVVSSAELASEILKSHDLESCSRPDLKGTRRLSYNFLDIAFGPYTEYWREMRKLTVLELFSVKRVQSFRFIREEEVSEMMSLISKSSSSATPINLNEMFFNLTDEIICRVAFGRSYKGRGFDDGRFGDAIKEAVAILGSFSATDFFPYVGWILDRFTGLHGRQEKCFLEFDHFYQNVIDEHLKNERDGSEQEDIIDVLLKVGQDQKGGGSLSNDHIKGMLMNIFLGAVDTSAVVLAWAMTELAKNPEVMMKLQDEIRSTVRKKGKVVEEDIEQLKFLKMVVKETLRLHSPIPLLIPRETRQHFTIKGYDIYPKTRVLVNVWAIGRDPKYWNKPEEFMPERFMDSSIDFKGTHFMLLPFGAGRRICPGMHMGIATVELTLANLMYAFDWGLPNGMKKEDIDVDETSGLLAHKKSPIYLVPIEQNINLISI